MRVLRRIRQSGKRQLMKVNDQQGRVTTKREDILRIVEDFHHALFKSLNEANTGSNIDPEIITSKKEIIN